MLKFASTGSAFSVERWTSLHILGRWRSSGLAETGSPCHESGEPDWHSNSSRFLVHPLQRILGIQLQEWGR